MGYLCIGGLIMLGVSTVVVVYFLWTAKDEPYPGAYG